MEICDQIHCNFYIVIMSITLYMVGWGQFAMNMTIMREKYNGIN